MPPIEPPRPSLDQTVIGGSFAHAPDGVFSANAAAGVGNVQVNLRSLADGASSGAAAYARQRIDAPGADRARDASVHRLSDARTNSGCLPSSVSAR